MRKIKQQIKATETHCYRCGQRIDWSIPYRDEHGNVNMNAGTVEHKQPLAQHPHLAEDPGNLAASHVLCNLAAGDRNPTPTLGVITQEW